MGEGGAKEGGRKGGGWSGRGLGNLLLAGWLGVHKSWVIVLYCMYKVQTSLPQGGKNKNQKRKEADRPCILFFFVACFHPRAFLRRVVLRERRRPGRSLLSAQRAYAKGEILTGRWTASG